MEGRDSTAFALPPHLQNPSGPCGASLPSRCATADCSWLGVRRVLFSARRTGSTRYLGRYSDMALRVWSSARVSWWLTTLLHSFLTRRRSKNRCGLIGLTICTPRNTPKHRSPSSMSVCRSRTDGLCDGYQMTGEAVKYRNTRPL